MTDVTTALDRHYCARCDSSQGTHTDRGPEWCAVCWDERKPLPATVRQRLADQDTEIQRLREERDAAWTTQGRYFREALAAEAEVRQLREVVKWARQLEREIGKGRTEGERYILSYLRSHLNKADEILVVDEPDGGGAK